MLRTRPSCPLYFTRRTRPSCIVHRWTIDTTFVSIASEIGDTTVAGRWRHLTPPKLLPLTNQTKLTLIITLTVTDSVTVIFFTCILLTPTKRLYRNNERNFCGGSERGSWVGHFFQFADKNAIVSSYFIVERGVFVGIYKKKGLGLLGA